MRTKPLDRITLRKWQALKRRDPRIDLVNLGRLQSKCTHATHDDLRKFKVNGMRGIEHKQAALFTYFISYAILKCPIEYAMNENEDYDCVLFCNMHGKERYARVQLKEIVPDRINPADSIETGLAKLSKYRASHYTVVAVHVNRAGYFDYSSIQKPETSFAEIWLYASLQADQSLWALYGDLLHGPRGYEIPWPTLLEPR